MRKILGREIELQDASAHWVRCGFRGVKDGSGVSAAEGLRAAVLADMGLTIASEWMFAPELASGAVRRVLSDWTLPSLDLWAVFPAGRMASAKARQSASFVEAAMPGSHSETA